MRTLLVLRHAKASHDDEGMTDHDRPLTKKGRNAARFIGELLRERGMLPELVLSSSAERTRVTTEVVLEAAGHSTKTLYLGELYLAEPPAYLDALRRLGGSAERVLVVGHNPGIEALIFRLTGQVEHMPTAALADCSVRISEWSELDSQTGGELRQVFRPKDRD